MSVYTAKEIEDLRETFRAFDVNKDGEIDVFELRNVLKMMHIHATHTELMEMIHSVDKDNSETIDFPEFLDLMKSRVGHGGPDEDLRKAFLQFDKRNKGYIDKESLRSTMKAFHNPLTEAELEAIFDEADLDKDGRITFREFQMLMVSKWSIVLSDVFFLQEASCFLFVTNTVQSFYVFACFCLGLADIIASEEKTLWYSILWVD